MSSFKMLQGFLRPLALKLKFTQPGMSEVAIWLPVGSLMVAAFCVVEHSP